MTSQEYLIGQKHILIKLENQKKWHDNNVETAGKQLVKELQKIPDWDCMMLSCYDHYKKYPSEFFDWCKYSFEYDDFDGTDDEKDILYVKKYYSGDPSGLVVLRLDLKLPLEDQVKKRLEDIEDRKNRELKSKYQKDMQTLESLHIPTIDFDEWLKRNDHD